MLFWKDLQEFSASIESLYVGDRYTESYGAFLTVRKTYLPWKYQEWDWAVYDFMHSKAKS